MNCDFGWLLKHADRYAHARNRVKDQQGICMYPDLTSLGLGVFHRVSMGCELDDKFIATSFREKAQTTVRITYIHELNGNNCMWPPQLPGSSFALSLEQPFTNRLHFGIRISFSSSRHKESVCIQVCLTVTVEYQEISYLGILITQSLCRYMGTKEWLSFDPRWPSGHVGTARSLSFVTHFP